MARHVLSLVEGKAVSNVVGDGRTRLTAHADRPTREVLSGKVTTPAVWRRGRWGKLVRGKQGLVSLQGPTRNSKPGVEDHTRQFYEQSRSIVYFAVITVPHVASAPADLAALSERGIGSTNGPSTSLRRACVPAISRRRHLHQRRGHRRRTSSSVHRKRFLLPVICFKQLSINRLSATVAQQIQSDRRKAGANFR